MSGALASRRHGCGRLPPHLARCVQAVLFLAAGVVIHAAGTNSLAAMSRMSGLARRIPDAYWTMTVALLALAAIPPFAGFFSKEAVPSPPNTPRWGPDRRPAAAGWTILVAGLLAAVLTASYAVRLWLLAFRGRGAEVPDHGKQPLAMTSVLWILTVPTIGFGLTAGMLGDWFDGHGLTPSLTTAVLSTGVTLVGGLVTYGAWRHTTALAARTPHRSRGRPPGCRTRSRRSRGHDVPHRRLRHHRGRPRPGRPRQAPPGPAAPPRGHRLPPRRPVHGAVRPARPGSRPPRPLPGPRGRRHLRQRDGLRHPAPRHRRPPGPDRQRADLRQRLCSPGPSPWRSPPSSSPTSTRGRDRDRYQPVRDAVPSGVHRRRPLLGALAALLPAPPGLRDGTPTRPCSATA